MNPLRIIFAGSGEFGLPTLAALLDAGHRLVQVVSQPDRPAGRGRKLTPTPIAQFALDRGLPLERTDVLNALPLPPADVMVVIAFGQKIAPAVVNHPRLGSVNLHSSRLPRFRGAAPINWAILAGDAITGNSIIRLAEKMDAGAILAQSELTIGDSETAGELHDRLARDGAPLMLKTLAALANGTAVETPQDHSLATIAPKLSRESAVLDWSMTPFQIARKINGLSPWPGCRVRLLSPSGEELARLTLLRAKPMAEAPSRGSASIHNPLLPVNPIDGTPASGGVIAGNTVDRFVEILDVQPEGKRPMTLAAYRNGYPWPDGARLQSIA
jgi:methionyl-tRNA formyltransferase